MFLAPAILCGLVFWSTPTEAALVTIQIEAVVDSVWDEGDYLEVKINPGDIIGGSYTYDLLTPDSEPLAYTGIYEYDTPPAGISLNVGGFEFRTNPANVNFSVVILNDHPWFDPHINKDNYVVASNSNLNLSNGTSVDKIVWQLDDPTGNALSDDALPTTAPFLSDWQSNILSIGTLRRYGISAHVTSVIPEPCTMLFLGLGVLVLRKIS